MRWHRRKATQILPAATVDALRTLESRVRPDFRRAVVFGVLALAALVAGHGLGGIHASTLHLRLAAWACAAFVACFGALAARAAANEVDRMITARAGVGAGATLRWVVLLVGYLIALLAVLDLLAVPVQLLAGGTAIAVVVGIAAQQVLGNLFAGLVLLFARPYVPGEHIRVNSGALGGPHEGTVSSVGLLYTTLDSEDGPINIPNSGMLAAAVGPVTVDEVAEVDSDALGVVVQPEVATAPDQVAEPGGRSATS